MQSSTLTRITVGTLGVLLTGTTAFAVHQVDQANAWQKEAAGWQSTAVQTNQATAQLTAQVRKYNKLAKATNAQSAAVAPVTISASAPVQAATVQAAPAAAPTSKAS